MKLFKHTHTQQQAFTVSWAGKTDRAPTISPVVLQIFNRTAVAWETLASNATSSAGVNFLLTGSIFTNLGNYFDGGFVLSARVYQQAQ